MPTSEPDSVSAALTVRLRAAIEAEGGWLPFDRYMAEALYAPGLGYYANSSRKFGWLPESGSDFVTAPELSPLFGRALALQVAQALQASGTREVFEFGAGSGALAEQVLDALAAAGVALDHYSIVDLSGTLRARQAQRLARFGDTVRWLDAWPAEMRGVVLGNEVLDAMPVQLLVRSDDGTQWLERGVVWHEGQLVFADRPTELAIPFDGPVLPGTVTEIHPQAEAFVRSLASHLKAGAAFFIDYGFPEAEYYHPQRHQGTLMCHAAHQADPDPLDRPGEKDITAHVNFTGIALAAQEAGLQVLGYTSQARFLFNCGLLDLMAAADLKTKTMALKLVDEHEMGELFKVIALGAPGLDLDPLGFTEGDRTHRL
ncbi:SAM-dependent methyltransferase [Ideonella sp. B7]|uniref:class I SAM-dependent methyltransferase n=1 Tax=Ideonella benzenivorans TaxID=2831643 RepID=UPI001CECAC82|nr:SAM-dependent methyltransferase [Ideonella benzenivorans]MCA6217253.1 SAM-dependent methyltransferase [Ideonella benzenivorans]